MPGVKEANAQHIFKIAETYRSEKAEADEAEALADAREKARTGRAHVKRLGKKLLVLKAKDHATDRRRPDADKDLDIATAET